MSTKLSFYSKQIHVVSSKWLTHDHLSHQIKIKGIDSEMQYKYGLLIPRYIFATAAVFCCRL